MTSSIPGLGDYDSDDDSGSGGLSIRKQEPAQKETYYFAMGADPSGEGEMSIQLCCAPPGVSPKDHEKELHLAVMLQELTESEVNSLGVELEEKEIDLEDDNYIHCERCDKYYRASCKLHPLMRVKNAVYKPKGKESARLPPAADLTLPPTFKIRPSKIENAGSGIFTDVPIPRGMLFGPYEGVLIDNAKDAFKEGYCWEIVTKGDRKLIDGSDPNYSNWLRYINHSRHEEEQNVLAFQYLGSVYYRVIRTIEANKEILVYYGDNFDRELAGEKQGGVFSTERRKKSTKLPMKNPFIKM